MCVINEEERIWVNLILKGFTDRQTEKWDRDRERERDRERNFKWKNGKNSLKKTLAKVLKQMVKVGSSQNFSSEGFEFWICFGSLSARCKILKKKFELKLTRSRNFCWNSRNAAHLSYARPSHSATLLDLLLWTWPLCFSVLHILQLACSFLNNKYS